MSSTVGPWEVGCHVGIPEGHSPTEAVTVSMYITLVALSWTMQVAYIIVTVGPFNISGCFISGGPQWEPERVIPSAGRPQPP